jgi:hypothetical protein
VRAAGCRGAGCRGEGRDGDVPQEPAAFQPRDGLMEALERHPAGRVVFAVTGIRGWARRRSRRRTRGGGSPRAGGSSRGWMLVVRRRCWLDLRKWRPRATQVTGPHGESGSVTSRVCPGVARAPQELGVDLG